MCLFQKWYRNSWRYYDQAHTLAGKHDRSGLRLWTVPEKVVRHRMGVLSVADPFAKLPQSLPPGGVVHVVNLD